jgi:hypothetical protein
MQENRSSARLLAAVVALPLMGASVAQAETFRFAFQSDAATLDPYGIAENFTPNSSTKTLALLMWRLTPKIRTRFMRRLISGGELRSAFKVADRAAGFIKPRMAELRGQN